MKVSSNKQIRVKIINSFSFLFIMIGDNFIKRNKIVIFLAVILFMRKIIDSKLFIGITVGFILCYILNNLGSVSSLIKQTSVREDKDGNYPEFPYINKDIKLQRAFMDISRYENYNYQAINNAIKHMEQFLRIKNNFKNVENTKQFYDLAFIERKNSMDSLRSLLLQIPVRNRKKLIKIIKYISKVSKRYLISMAQINNDRWNHNETSSDMGPIYIDRYKNLNE